MIVFLVEGEGYFVIVGFFGGFDVVIVIGKLYVVGFGVVEVEDYIVWCYWLVICLFGFWM